MRKTGIILLVFVALFSAASSKAQDAEEIVKKHVAAIGGTENWKKIKTIRLTGKTSNRNMEIPMTITIKQGKGFKVEYDHTTGMTGYTIITDKGGWLFNPFSGAKTDEPLPEELVKLSQDNLDIAGPLIDYQAKGNKITYEGTDTADGAQCYKLKVVYATGKEETVYINKTNYYHIRSVEDIKLNGQEQEQKSEYQKP